MSSRRWLLAPLLVPALVASLSGNSSAQAAPPDTAPADTTPPARTGAAPLFVRRDAFVAAGFVVATLALIPFDDDIALEIREPETQGNRLVRHAAKNVEYVADPGTIIFGVATYTLGRAFHAPRVADVGLHGTEAVIAGSALTAVLKGLAGRSRPFVHADTNARDFRFGHGMSGADRQSFPSGHTTAAFAAAAAITREAQRWWPRSTWVVAPVLYGGAAMVGASRMYHDRHWASDVVLGAGIGTFAGLKIVRFNHRTAAGNRLDRLLLGVTAGVDAHGNSYVRWGSR